VITFRPIVAEEVLGALIGRDGGAVVSFTGVVRSENRGRDVLHIRYEAYASLVERELARIVDEVRADLGVSRARAIHRVGDVAVGEASLVVGVTARHRAAAFAACGRIVDEIKHRVPIWKKEFYADGSSEWI
jgi:molybdopterin synthase catalytic subunit